MSTDTMIPVLAPLTCEYQKCPYPRVAGIIFNINFLSIADFIHGYPQILRIRIFLTTLVILSIILIELSDI